MLISYKRGQGSVILRIKLLDSSVSTGAGKTGLTSSSSGLIVSTIADNESTATAYSGSNLEGISTLGTYAAPTSGKCRFKEVDATNHKGVYEIQLADARFAVSSAKSLLVSVSGVSGMAETDAIIPLTDMDFYDLTVQADGLLDRSAGVETSWTVRQALRIILSALAGKVSGAGTTTIVFRDQADSKDRISATVDSSGNRTAITYDKT